MKKKKGFYYGLNATNKNIIFSCGEKTLNKKNVIVLGKSGSGKVFANIKDIDKK